MASKYLQKFPIPGSFPDLLHDFAREVLRDQPEDIYAYGAAYFKALEEVSLSSWKVKSLMIHFRALNSIMGTKGRRSLHLRSGSQAEETINRCQKAHLRNQMTMKSTIKSRNDLYKIVAGRIRCLESYVFCGY